MQSTATRVLVTVQRSMQTERRNSFERPLPQANGLMIRKTWKIHWWGMKRRCLPTPATKGARTCWRKERFVIESSTSENAVRKEKKPRTYSSEKNISTRFTASCVPLWNISSPPGNASLNLNKPGIAGWKESISRFRVFVLPTTSGVTGFCQGRSVPESSDFPLFFPSTGKLREGLSRFL